MKPKGKWSLHLNSSLISEETSTSTSRPIPDEKKKYPRHLSMHHEKELKRPWSKTSLTGIELAKV